LGACCILPLSGMSTAVAHLSSSGVSCLTGLIWSLANKQDVLEQLGILNNAPRLLGLVLLSVMMHQTFRRCSAKCQLKMW
jgi:hypothetical protein